MTARMTAGETDVTQDVTIVLDAIAHAVIWFGAKLKPEHIEAVVRLAGLAEAGAQSRPLSLLLDHWREQRSADKEGASR